MSRLAMFVALAMSLGTASTGVQAPPDFSGKWTLLHEEGAATGAAAFGEEFTVTQSSTSLIVDWKALTPGGRGTPRGTLVERPVHSVFPFDGSESNIGWLRIVSSSLEFFDTASWNGDRLVILHRSRPSPAFSVHRQRTIWLGPDGTLVVQTSEVTGRPNDPPVVKMTNRYRRHLGG